MASCLFYYNYRLLLFLVAASNAFLALYPATPVNTPAAIALLPVVIKAGIGITATSVTRPPLCLLIRFLLICLDFPLINFDVNHG